MKEKKGGKKDRENSVKSSWEDWLYWKEARVVVGFSSLEVGLTCIKEQDSDPPPNPWKKYFPAWLGSSHPA